MILSRSILQRLDPVATTFLVSSLLSMLAIATGTLNRDGMLYVETARAFMDGGLSAALAIFSWPFLAVLMGGLAKVTGLSPELCGHFLNVLFMSGSCALLVAIVRQNEPELAWLSAIVVIAIPGLNEYRNELIREYGCWFFVMLTFWLAKDWPTKPGWRRCFAIQLALLFAALFRPEALVFYPCILLWQHFQPVSAGRAKRLLMLGTLPALGLIVILFAYFNDTLSASSRIANEISRFNFSRFNQTANDIGLAFNAYAREDARTAHTILFFGSLALIPWKLIGKFGPFLLPLFFYFKLSQGHEALTRQRLLFWGFCGHLLVLSVFVLQQQFVSGRYLGPLLLFSTPFVARGLYLLLNRYPNWKLPTLAIIAVIALSNVVSLNPGKLHFVEAGKWLSSQWTDSPRIYVESARTAHYAGWRFSTRTAPLSREQLLAEIRENRYDLIVLEVSRKDKTINKWVVDAGLTELRGFTDNNGDAIVIYTPNAQSLPGNTESMTASKREKTILTE